MYLYFNFNESDLDPEQIVADPEQHCLWDSCFFFCALFVWCGGGGGVGMTGTFHTKES